MHSKACVTAPYAARSSRLYHCVAAGGDRVTAVHADGGLRQRLSGALRLPVLRRWENQRMLSSLLLYLQYVYFARAVGSAATGLGRYLWFQVNYY